MYLGYRQLTWQDGVVAGVALVALAPLLWLALVVLGRLQALAAGSPLWFSAAPLVGALRWLLVATVAAAEVLLPLSLYRDARRLPPAPAGGWTPAPRLYAVGGLLFPLSGLVGGYYLLRRLLRVSR